MNCVSQLKAQSADESRGVTVFPQHGAEQQQRRDSAPEPSSLDDPFAAARQPASAPTFHVARSPSAQAPRDKARPLAAGDDDPAIKTREWLRGVRGQSNDHVGVGFANPFNGERQTAARV